jgi:hypothetical protein
MKIDHAGAFVWGKDFAPYNSFYNDHSDLAYSVIEHSIDHGFALVGYTSNLLSMVLVKTDSAGTHLWTRRFGGTLEDRAYSVTERSIGNELVIVGKTKSFGAGLDDFILIVVPGDGSGTAGNVWSPFQTKLRGYGVGDQTTAITSNTQNLTEGNVTLVEMSATITTTVNVANPTPSRTPSQSSIPSVSQTASSTSAASVSASQTSASSQSASSSQTASQTPSHSQTASNTASSSRTASQTSSQTSSNSQTPSHSQTASNTASISQTPSGTSTASQTSSQTSSLTQSAFASASASHVDEDLCADNLCASGASCVVVSGANQYTCDCTAISTATVRAVGRYCNATVEGKPVSVNGDNCPGCESAFVCTDSYSGGDADEFTEGVIPILAGAACDCANPQQALLDQFGAVQHNEQDDGSLCMEFTIYSGNPNATASDIAQLLETDPPAAFNVQTNRLIDFEPCEDEKKGCADGSPDSSDDSLVFVIIGVAACCLVLLLGIVWYFVHKRVDRQFTLQNEVTTTVNEIVVHKMQADMADAGDSKSPVIGPASSVTSEQELKRLHDQITVLTKAVATLTANQQFILQNEVTTTANEVVVHKMQANMADAGDSKSINDEITPVPAKQERLSDLQSSNNNNNINVPTAAAATGPRYSAFTKSIDTAASEDDYMY